MKPDAVVGFVEEMFNKGYRFFDDSGGLISEMEIVIGLIKNNVPVYVQTPLRRVIIDKDRLEAPDYVM